MIELSTEMAALGGGVSAAAGIVLFFAFNALLRKKPESKPDTRECIWVEAEEIDRAHDWYQVRLRAGDKTLAYSPNKKMTQLEATQLARRICEARLAYRLVEDRR